MFPFTVWLLGETTGKVYMKAVVKEPGVLYVPPKPEGVQESIIVKVEWADGTITCA